ncbi:MAG: adenylyl-sulfate kinase [Campylobacterales bacterium]|nr:adenylyl-sulfate kinase [Campylobacterales bacterium]
MENKHPTSNIQHSTSNNIVWHESHLNKAQRSQLKNQKPCILWFTGLSGSGKSTIANALEAKLYQLNHHTYLLDGDNVRHGLNKDLGFDDASRIENIRRIGEVAKLFVDSGVIVITAFISPFISDRAIVRSLVEDGEFIEVFIDTPIEICQQRDPKGLYQKALAGEIKNFTGIDSPYEAPIKPEIHIQTDSMSIENGVEKIVEYLKNKGYVC